MGYGIIQFIIGIIILTISLIFTFRFLRSFSNSVNDPIRKLKAKYVLIITLIFCIFNHTLFYEFKLPFLESIRFTTHSVIKPFLINDMRALAINFIDDISYFLLAVFYATVITWVIFIIKTKHNQSLHTDGAKRRT